MDAARWRSLVGRVALAAGLFLASFAGSCLEPPATEHLRLELLADGGARAVVRVRIRAETGDNPKVAARLRELRRAIASGDDDWSRRFDRLRPAEERLSWRRKDGELVEVERSARFADAGELVELFGDAPLQVSFRRLPGGAELAFYPGSGSRANRAERQAVERRLATWSGGVVSYLRTLATLHEQTAGEPQREQACLAVLFGDAETAKAVPLAHAEKALVEAADRALADLLDVLVVPAGEAYSLEELSRLEYDPFPADLEIEVAGEIREVDGFVRGPGSVLTVPGLSLWRSLPALAGRWPALVPLRQVSAEAEGSEQTVAIDTAALAAGLAHSEPVPSENELAAALARTLAPAPVYRVLWRYPPETAGRRR
ncbi:MAG: hypothetical protein ACM3OB_03705 [Acidobacteriota bacterium]